MNVPVLFALIGSVILVGFLANLLFRVTKIPSVLALIAIGVVLGPVTGWIRHEALLSIAPYFGAIALLVILFEGGLELEIGHVVTHAPRTAMFTAVVFCASLVSVASVVHFALGWAWLQALMLGAILGATSPAISMPVVAGLSIRNDVKAVIKLESAIGEVLLIVSVVLLMQTYQTGAADAAHWVWGFVRSLGVAVLVASVAGVLWSRLVGWLGREPLSYMLTLGVTFLLYFAVEELGGSPAIAVLLFGLLLANMQLIAARIGPRLRDLFGIDVREDQFVLGQFMVNITAELSFLVRTFFFVYLGLLLDFSALSWSLSAWIAATFLVLLASRRLGIMLFRRGAFSFRDAEWQTVMALQPRGLATAVVAFMPVEAGIDNVALFPLFAFVVIVLSNLYMTGGILFAERRLRQQGDAMSDETPQEQESAQAASAALATGEAAHEPATTAHQIALPRRPPLFSPARDFEDEPAPTNLTDWMARFFGLRLADRETEYADLIRASYLSEPLFWVQTVLGASICALGLILGQPAIIIGASLIVPVVRPVVAMGLALASGDLLLLVKVTAKLLLFSALAVGASAILIDLLPFALTPSEIAARTRPTILDFLVALCGGMSAAALVTLRRRTIYYLPGAVMAITLLPALCAMGFGLSDSVGGSVLRGAGLQFSANIFAAVLGAGAILSLVGLPKAAQAPSIRQWKDEELSAPLARAVFGRLGLERTIGRTGSGRARVIVVAIFLLALLTPLQLALNQLRKEFLTRQTIATAQDAFNLVNRSAVIGSAIALGGEVVDVRLQVATNELFSAADVARFEDDVLARSGRRARLELVQTMADVGNAGALRRLLNERGAAEPRRTVFESLQELTSRVTAIMQELPLPESLTVVDVRSTIAGPGLPAITLVYLADDELSADARDVLTGLLVAQTQLATERVSFQWVPARYGIRLARSGAIQGDDAVSLRRARAALESHPGLRATLDLPPGLPASRVETIGQRMRDELGVTTLEQRTADDTSDKSAATLRLTKAES